jgi:DNA-binding Lrp family transcriptional regulator
MSDLLKILQETADPDSSKLAKILDLAEADVDKQLQELKESGALLGWVPLLHPSKAFVQFCSCCDRGQDKP